MSKFDSFCSNYYVKIMEDCYKQLSPLFVDTFKPKIALSESYFENLKSTYLKFRKIVQNDILSKTNNKQLICDDEKKLNFSKLAAIVCCTVMKNKPITFGKSINDKTINAFIEHNIDTTDDFKLKTEYIINNMHINYRIAVNAGLSFLFINFVGKMTEAEKKVCYPLVDNWEKTVQFNSFNSEGQDTYLNTLIKTLARNEYYHRNIDVVMLSLVFASIQEVLDCKKKELLASK